MFVAVEEVSQVVVLFRVIDKAQTTRLAPLHLAVVYLVRIELVHVKLVSGCFKQPDCVCKLLEEVLSGLV